MPKLSRSCTSQIVMVLRTRSPQGEQSPTLARLVALAITVLGVVCGVALGLDDRPDWGDRALALVAIGVIGDGETQVC